MNNPDIKRYLLLIYNLTIVALAVSAALLSFMDIAHMIPEKQYQAYIYIDYIILGILALDYLFRLYRSKDKKAFVKRNIINLIALIPVHSSFRIFMLSRLVHIAYLARFAKLLVIFNNIHLLIASFLKTNKLLYAFYLTISTLFICSASFYVAEVKANPNITHYLDALWFSIVTVSTVGYGDISPATGIGRIIASFLMLIGIGFTSFLTGTLATFFIHGKEEISMVPPSEDLPKLSIDDPLLSIDISDLSPEQQNHLHHFLAFLRSNSTEFPPINKGKENN